MIVNRNPKLTKKSPVKEQIDAIINNFDFELAKTLINQVLNNFDANLTLLTTEDLKKDASDLLNIAWEIGEGSFSRSCLQAYCKNGFLGLRAVPVEVDMRDLVDTNDLMD
jgi:hypothetical protein